MHRFTTPTVPVRITGADLSACRVWVTFSQGRQRCVNREVTGQGQEIEPLVWDFAITLTQQETARLSAGKAVRVQANIIDQNGYRAASNEETAASWSNLMERIA